MQNNSLDIYIRSTKLDKFKIDTFDYQEECIYTWKIPIALKEPGDSQVISLGSSSW